jgi:hypothetical protein
VSKNTRGYKSEKRKKELARQKKQEEKRQRRLNKHADNQDENRNEPQVELEGSTDTDAAKESSPID